MPLDRKRAIYAIASQHDVLILEDDPYYYLSYGPYATPNANGNGHAADSAELVVPPPSFFSIDEDARVLRFDSFSKILSAGLRLGWVTGPTPLVDRIILHIQVRLVLCCCSLCVSVASSI